MSSNIASRTKLLGQEMKSQLTEEQVNLYEDYFDRYFAHLGFAPEHTTPSAVTFDSKLIATMMDALTDVNPRFTYKTEPLRYKFYYTLFKFLPLGWVERYTVEKFMMMPKYNKN